MVGEEPTIRTFAAMYRGEEPTVMATVRTAVCKQIDLYWCHALLLRTSRPSSHSAFCKDPVRNLSGPCQGCQPSPSYSSSFHCETNHYPFNAVAFPVHPCPQHACGIPATLQYFGSHPLSVLQSTAHPSNLAITVRFERLICASFILHRNDPIIEAE